MLLIHGKEETGQHDGNHSHRRKACALSLIHISRRACSPSIRPSLTALLGTCTALSLQTPTRSLGDLYNELLKQDVYKRQLEDEAASRAYIEQMWAEAMEIYRSGRFRSCLLYTSSVTASSGTYRIPFSHSGAAAIVWLSSPSKSSGLPTVKMCIRDSFLLCMPLYILVKIFSFVKRVTPICYCSRIRAQ